MLETTLGTGHRAVNKKPEILVFNELTSSRLSVDIPVDDWTGAGA